jgi:uncharacterized protein (TIGR04255 family)
MIDQSALDEVFPNNPLREVAFEIRFPRNLRILPQIYQFQEYLGGEFNIYGREETIAINSPIIYNYVFQTQANAKIIKVWEDKFVFVVTKYESFEKFVKVLVEYSQNFCSIYKVTQLGRIGLRYVNNLILPEGFGVQKITEYVRPYVNLASFSYAELAQYSTESLLVKTGCSLIARSGFASSKSNNIYVLDIDAFIEGPRGPKDLRSIVDNLHQEVQLEFLGHVTDSYKQIMRRSK